MAENEMLTDVPLTQIRDFLHHPYGESYKRFPKNNNYCMFTKFL